MMDDAETALVQSLWKVIKQARVRETQNDQLPDPRGSIELIDRRGDLIIATNRAGSSKFNQCFLVSSHSLTGTLYFKNLLGEWGKEAEEFKRAKLEGRIAYIEILTEHWDDGLYGLLKLLHNQVISDTSVFKALAVAMTADQMLCLDIACVQYFIKAALIYSPDEQDPEQLVMYLILAGIVDDAKTFSAICRQLVMTKWDTEVMRGFFDASATIHIPENTFHALLYMRRTLFNYISELALFDRPEGLLSETVEDPCDWQRTFRPAGSSPYLTVPMRQLLRDGHAELHRLLGGIKADLAASISFRSWVTMRHGMIGNTVRAQKTQAFRDRVATICAQMEAQQEIVCLGCLKRGWSQAAVHEPKAEACVAHVASHRQARHDLEKCPDSADWSYEEAHREAMRMASIYRMWGQ